MKKSIFLLFAIILLVGSVLGCSSGNKTPAATKTPSGGAESTTQPESKPEPEPEGPLKFSWSFPTTVVGGYVSRVDLKTEKWLAKQAELFNVHVDARVTEDEKMGLMFAGGDIPDVVGGLGTPSSKSMSGSVEAGVFQPLTALIKEHTPDLYNYIPQSAWDAVTLNGEIYGVPSFLSNPSRRGTYMRMDLLEQTGKPVPVTIDDFVDVLREFKKIGVQYPYAMRENFKYADVVFGAFDVLPYRDQFMEQDGKIIPKFFQADKMQAALQVMKTMFDEGLIPKDFASITSADYNKSFQSGNAAMWSQNATGLPSIATTIRDAVPTAKVDIIPSPVGPDGKGGYFFYSPVITTHYINKNVELERTIRILKFFEWQALSKEAEMFYTFGVEGEDYTVDANGTINYISMPTTKEEQEEEGFRTGTIRGVADATINSPLKLALTEDGRRVTELFDTVLANEGLGGIGFYPELESTATFPDLGFPQQDVGPPFIIDNMVKIIYGVRPITDWPKVIEEYLQRGGQKIIDEANERYKNNEGVLHLYR